MTCHVRYTQRTTIHVEMRAMTARDERKRSASVRELNQASISLLVSTGMIASVMDRYPAVVQENFRLRVEEYCGAIREMTDEIHFFGRSYDEEV